MITLEEVKNNAEIKALIEGAQKQLDGLGYTELDKKFYKLYCQNKWYYCLNSNGAFCSNYINLVRKNCK